MTLLSTSSVAQGQTGRHLHVIPFCRGGSERWSESSWATQQQEAEPGFELRLPFSPHSPSAIMPPSAVTDVQ